MPSILFAQKTSIIKGFIKDSQNNSIKNVSVNYGTIGVYSNNKGYYEIRVPVNEKVVIEFSHVGYKSLSKEFFINKRTRMNRRIPSSIEEISLCHFKSLPEST